MNIKKALSGVAVVKVIGAGLGFVSHVVLARVMTIDGYGAYVYIWTWLVVLSLLCRLGFGNLVIRYIPKLSTKQKWTEVAGIIGTSFFFVTASSILISTVGICNVHWEVITLSGIKEKSLIYALVMLPLVTWLYVSQQVLRGLKRVVKANVPQLIIRHILLIVSCFLIWNIIGKLTVETALTVTYVAILLSLGVAFTWIINDIRGKTRLFCLASLNLNYIYKAVPFLIISGMGLIQRKTDILMLGILVEASDVASYNVSTRIITIVSFSLVIANITFGPLLSELFTKRKWSAIQQLTSTISACLTCVTIGVLIVLVVYGSSILSIFGTEYKDGLTVIFLLAIGRSVSAMVGPVGHLMMMTDNETTASKVEVCVALLNFALNGLLIPFYGVAGAAVATSCSIALRNLMLSYIIWTRHSINTTIFNCNLIININDFINNRVYFK